VRDAFVFLGGRLHLTICQNNIFSYSLNNPITFVDPSGNRAATIDELMPLPIPNIPPEAIDDALTAIVTTLAGVGMLAVEKSLERVDELITTLPHNQTVYALIDVEQNVQYIGRTTSETARKIAHRANPARKNLSFVPLVRNLTYFEARGLEQILMLSCHTINASNEMNNQINGISPMNPSLNVYMSAAKGTLKYFENAFDNEYLNWTGQ